MVASIEVVNEVILHDKLVDLWQDYPCLYDASLADYKDRNKRDKALEEIALALEKEVKWVKARMKALRDRYKKAKKPKPSGSANRKVQEKTKWLLNKLQFLAPYSTTQSISNLNSPPPIPRCSTPTPTCNTSTSSTTSTPISIDESDIVDDESLLHDEENEEDEVNDVATNNYLASRLVSEIPPKSTKMPLKVTTSRKRQAEEEFNLIKGLTSAIQERAKRKADTTSDSSMKNAAYGKYIAEVLSDLQPRERALAQYRINEVIFQAQPGIFSSHTSATSQPQSSEYNYNNWGSQQIYNSDRGCFSQEHSVKDSTRLYTL